jgi:hypothetical protein
MAEKVEPPAGDRRPHVFREFTQLPLNTALTKKKQMLVGLADRLYLGGAWLDVETVRR